MGQKYNFLIHIFVGNIKENKEMSGIKELDLLLSTLEPVLDERDFVFCSFPDFQWEQINVWEPICLFQEKEGTTLIITKEKAIEKRVNTDSLYRLISLNVHSSLDAVGLTAAISAKLTEKNISANVVAAYYHDHIFVPKDKAEQALIAILELQR